MYPKESYFLEALQSAEIKIDPNPTHVREVRERMITLARNGPGRRRRAGNVWMVGLLLCGVGGVGLAATETGRDLIRWMLTPVQPRYEVAVTTPDGTTWTRSGGTEPYSPEQRRSAAAQFGEIAELKEAGLGELVGLIEGPDHTIYLVKYTLKDGTTTTVGSVELSNKQAVNMRIEDIQRLRDTGAGDLLVESPSPTGLGCYTIRFTLPDRTVDLQTWYPPGPRQEREAIFAETRRLKAALRFSVVQAGVPAESPEQGVVGTLRYTLADGRTVGIVEPIPADAVTPDGAFVVVPDTGETLSVDPGTTWIAPDGSQYIADGGVESRRPVEKEAVLDKFREVYAIKKAGGGQLVGLLEGPGFFGELSTTTFQVKYTLKSGETLTIGDGTLSKMQRTNMRMDEIQRLRDSGAGVVLSQSESPLGLGRFTIRFALANGDTVDLQTVYPPSTRQEREAIFAETRKLKAQQRYSVKDARVVSGSGVWGRFVYTLADGRSVSHYEPVPTALISSDGKRIVLPGSGESIEIKGRLED